MAGTPETIAGFYASRRENDELPNQHGDSTMHGQVVSKYIACRQLTMTYAPVDAGTVGMLVEAHVPWTA